MNPGLLLPEIILAVSAIVVILLDLATERKGWLAAVSIMGIVVSLASAMVMWGGDRLVAFNNMLAIDNFGIFFKLLFLVIAALVILASVDYVSKFQRFQGEYYALVLLSTLGMMLMAATTELITIYISLELASLSLCALVCFLREPKSAEASVKYILLSGIASAVLLFGMAMVFGFTGKTQLGEIARVVQTIPEQSLLANPGLILGIVLLVAGFGFKIASVPFHMWVPDVYEGAPTPITAFLSVGSKAAGFAVILRVFYTAFEMPGLLSTNWALIFAALSALSMSVGNVVAIQQTNIKRMLGYSSIAQAGYLMVGLATVGVSQHLTTIGQSSVIFFLVSYSLTNLGAFIAIIAITNKLNSDLIADFSGMGKRAPLMALGLTLCMISLIGMPPAAGFMAKFYIFTGAVKQGLLWLVIIAVINSVISAYYYMRVVKVMWLGQPASEEGVPSSGALRLAMFLSCIGVLAFGIAPGAMMGLTELAVKMLGF